MTTTNQEPGKSEELLSTFFVEYSAARLPMELQAAVDKAMAAIELLIEERVADALEKVRNHAAAGPINTLGKARILDAIGATLGEGIHAQLPKPLKEDTE